MPDRAVSNNPDVQLQLDRLSQVSLPRDVLGFERIRALLGALGNPERALPPVLHVAGTNGKGSTCAFLRSCLEAAGLTVHAYTSPHLVDLNERIRLSGRLISDDFLAALLHESIDAVKGREITFFEATTAAAFLAFARTPADACIIEVGIGGRLDATNVIAAPVVCGITHLGLDHAIYLGETLEEIASEKAGIAKPHVPLVTQDYGETVSERVRRSAEAAGAPWFSRGREWDVELRGETLRYRDSAGEMSLPQPPLAGRHQALNAGLAVAMLRHQCRFRIDEPAYSAGIDQTEWSARLQKLDAGPLRDALPSQSELWLDGAHNPNAAEAVAQFFRARGCEARPLHLVFGLLSDRAVTPILEPFAGLAQTIHTVPVLAREFHPPEDIAETARGLGFDAKSALGVEDALASISRSADGNAAPIVLVLGSLYLAGEVLRANGQLPA